MQEVYRLLAQLHKHRLLADYHLEDKCFLDANTCALLVKSAAMASIIWMMPVSLPHVAAKFIIAFPNMNAK